MAALGSSFGVTPSGLEEQAQRLKKRTPTQQALQTLSLKLPKVLGAESAPPSDLMGGAYRPTIPGGGDAGQARMSALVRAMTGKRAGSARPAAPPRFTGGAVQTPAPPPVEEQGAGSEMPQPGRPAKGGIGPDWPAGLPKPPKRVSGAGTGSRDPKKLLGGLAGGVKAPPINPNIIGGGALEPPPVAAAPPPNYMAGYRGSIWDGSASEYAANQQRAQQGGAQADAQGRYVPTGGAPGYANRPY
jgi:hypothetical protein